MGVSVVLADAGEGVADGFGKLSDGGGGYAGNLLTGLGWVSIGTLFQQIERRSHRLSLHLERSGYRHTVRVGNFVYGQCLVACDVPYVNAS